jgi:hypothetical protein
MLLLTNLYVVFSSVPVFMLLGCLDEAKKLELPMLTYDERMPG